MNIVLTGFGYLSEVVVPLANKLSKTEDVTIISPNINYDFLVKNTRDNVVIEKVRSYRRSHPMNILILIDIIYKLKRIKPDVIYTQFVHTIYVPLILLMKDKFPFVSVIHDPTSHSGEEKLHYRIMRYVATRHSRKIVVHSKIMKNVLLNSAK